MERDFVMRSRLLIAFIFVFVAPQVPVRAQEERVYRDVSTQKLEAVLAAQKIDFMRNNDKVPGDFIYDFEHKAMKLRLHIYAGKDLWIDAQFDDKLPLEDLNRWNTSTRFARAVLLKDKVSLEMQLDCFAGTSDAIITQYLHRFFNELDQFVKFVNKK